VPTALVTKDCLGKAVLMELALAKEKFEDEYILTHIGHCGRVWTI
jgi:hypothetical protein